MLCPQYVYTRMIFSELNQKYTSFTFTKKLDSTLSRVIGMERKMDKNSMRNMKYSSIIYGTDANHVKY